jgi:hypothetical protein
MGSVIRQSIYPEPMHVGLCSLFGYPPILFEAYIMY